jgi:hypothetical protein
MTVLKFHPLADIFLWLRGLSSMNSWLISTSMDCASRLSCSRALSFIEVELRRAARSARFPRSIF